MNVQLKDGEKINPHCRHDGNFTCINRTRLSKCLDCEFDDRYRRKSHNHYSDGWGEEEFEE